jgi:RNA polymerase sigma factor (sigma-70 family)
MDAEKLLLENWDAVERAVAFTCRKHGLRGADAEDFMSVVKVRLFEDEFHIVEEYRGDSSFSTYVSVVVNRLFIDQCIKEHGKWRPSADAKRGGPVAVELERMVQWEGLSAEEAVQRAAAAHPELARADIEALAAHVAPRNRRRSTVALDECTTQLLTAEEEADALMIAHDRRKVAQAASEVVRGYLRNLEEQDRLILQLHFESGLQFSEIARMLQVEAKPLYRRKDELLKELRAAVQRAGLSADEVLDAIGHFEDEPRK